MKPHFYKFGALAFALALGGISCGCPFFDEPETITIDVLGFLDTGDLLYPRNQFTVVPGGRGCSAPYYTASKNVKVAYSISPTLNQTLANPDPNGCGFGRVADVKMQRVEIRQSDLNNYQGPAVAAAPTNPQFQIRTEGGGPLIGN